MTSPWATPELIHAAEMDTRIENRLDALDAAVLQLAGQAYALSNQVSCNNTTWTLATYDTQLFGANLNAFGGNYTAPSDTPPNTPYLMFGTGYWTNNSNGVRRCRFRRNGTVLPGSTGPPHPGNGSRPNVCFSWAMATLSFGDTLDMQIWQNSGGTLNTAIASGGVALAMTVMRIG